MTETFINKNKENNKLIIVDIYYDTTKNVWKYKSEGSRNYYTMIDRYTINLFIDFKVVTYKSDGDFEFITTNDVIDLKNEIKNLEKDTDYLINSLESWSEILGEKQSKLEYFYFMDKNTKKYIEKKKAEIQLLNKRFL